MARDIPIIFSGPMVRALLDGRKTMTRRLAHQKPQIAIQIGDGPLKPLMVDSGWQTVKPGDRLWVRESLKHVTSDPMTAEPCSLHCYAASIPPGMDSANPYEANYLFPEDGTPPLKPKSVPSIHMPRWASRLTLTVTGVKVERLYDISDDDIRAEGIQETDTSWLNAWRQLWESINGPGDWETNPFVVAVSFRVIKANIDAPEALAA